MTRDWEGEEEIGEGDGKAKIKSEELEREESKWMRKCKQLGRINGKKK